MSFTISLDAESENDDEDVLDLVASLRVRKLVKNGSNILRWARKKQKQYNIKYEGFSWSLELYFSLFKTCT